MSALPAENVRQIEPQALVTMTPMDMLARAVQSGADLDMIEKLMNLQERWEASNARKAFDEAVAAAKADIPVIVKNASSHNSKYADFAAIARAVDPVLSRHGIRYRFRTQQTEKSISVTCVLTHKDGHAEENTLTGPVDATVGKNPIQAIGSTLTYLQRYSLVQALGLAASNDDDGNTAGRKEPENYAPPPGSITEDQAADIREALEAKDASEKAFVQWAAGKGFFAGRKQLISEIPAERYDACMTAIAGFKKG